MKLTWNGWINSFCKCFIIPNFPIIVALVLLASAPIFLLSNNYDVANQNAGYAFYLLIAGIIWKVIQHSLKMFVSRDNILHKSSGTKT